MNRLSAWLSLFLALSISAAVADQYRIWDWPKDRKMSIVWYGGPTVPQMLVSVGNAGEVTIDWKVCEEVAKLDFLSIPDSKLWESVAIARMLLSVRDGTYKAKE